MGYTYQIGSRGFIVGRLQTKLGIVADNIFGPQTAAAVGRLQQRRAAAPVAPVSLHTLSQLSGSPASSQPSGSPVSSPPPGYPVSFAPHCQAGAAEFTLAGLPWPSDFERAMNLVTCFEGTGFGDCNLRDIDGAGLTLGIAGFTTGHGEVQELLRCYVTEMPGCAHVLPAKSRITLFSLLNKKSSASAWRKLFFHPDGTVRPEWRAAFAEWGRCPVMRRLQLELAHQWYWLRARSTMESLGFTTVRAATFFLDVTVQNGGWRGEHLAVAKTMSDWTSGEESRALAVAARAVAACARERWRNDVLARKLAIATGSGMVHGRMWNLKHFGLL